VERYWPGERAVGRRLQRGKAWLEVVGVGRTMKHLRLSEVDEPMVWLPLLQADRGDLTLHVRTSGDPERLLPVVQKTLRAIEPKLPIYDVSTLERRIRIGSLFERLAGTFVGSFGLVALALAAVGMYGVIAYSTRQRTREIGIRLALGARPSQVFGLVLRQAGLLSGLGLGLGLIVAAGTTRFHDRCSSVSARPIHRAAVGGSGDRVARGVRSAGVARRAGPAAPRAAARVIAGWLRPRAVIAGATIPSRRPDALDCRRPGQFRDPPRVTHTAISPGPRCDHA
jgi:hypothetical protein